MAERPEKLAEKLGEQFNKATAEEILTYFLTHYKGKIVQGSGMGAEDQVITRMISTIDKTTRIITLDTGRLFQETYDLIQKTNEHFGFKIGIYFPDYEKVEQMVKEKGINLFYGSLENRRLCCHIRKNEPLKRALKGMDVWICGLRKNQTITRFYNKAVEWDEQHGLIRVNPLINWTEKQVWDYIREHQIPYNVLHDKGYPSIGCLPCTRAVKPGEDPRSGRWWWEDKGPKECGLHYK
ncbi:MAG: phosphoadenosine phosphosulfate reductase [Bacteroides sp. SM23_62_1]|nr:MAG: phosphoadenosine phosphosulfate reductase [Bacteroides sp. SM23_62_1]